KISAGVLNQPDICSELEGVPSMNPRHVVREIVYRCHAADVVRLAIRLEHKSEADIVSGAVSTLRERLTRVSVPEVVYPIVSNRPRMAYGQARRMVPHLGRERIRKESRQLLMIVDHVPTKEQRLLRID